MNLFFDAQAYLHLGIAIIAFIGARLAARWPWLKWFVVILSVYLSLRYFLWRTLYTLNLENWIGILISVTLLLAECYGFLAALLFYFQTLRPKRETVPRQDDRVLPAVDIFVTIYDESTDILYRTLVACQAIEYPAKKIYVCDDGQRDEVRRVAERLGCNYLRGPRNEDAKAGNLNHALAATGGPLILTLDVDHVPVRTFLRETVGFFQDPRVALVQTAHHFYNPDIFQRNLRVETVASNEQDMFFHIVQPGRNFWNASFYCGTGAVLRRSSLKEVGGFRTETLTEDIHTSILLHSRGYRSVFVNKDLAAGLAPEDFVSYVRQRKRWGRGCFQVFLRANPFLLRGLTPGQRINYFASVFYFLHGLPRLIYLFAPLAYLLFRQYPLRATVPDLFSFYFPQLVAFLSVLPAITGVFRKAFWADIYETIICFPLTMTFLGMFVNPWKRKFEVTPKGLLFSRNTIRLGMTWWMIAVVALTVIGFWLGSFRLSTGQGDPPALIINLVWAFYNFVILISAILAAYERPQLREMPRIARSIPCEVKLDDGTRIETHTRNLSETGLSLDLHEIYSLSPEVEIDLRGDGEHTRIRGKLVRFDRRRGKEPSVGVRFHEPTEEQHQSLIRQMYSSPEVWANAHTRVEAGALASLWKIATSALRIRAASQILNRKSLRFPVAGDCRVRIDGRIFSAILRDVSSEGLAVDLIDSAPDPDDEVTVYRGEGESSSAALRCDPVYFRRSSGRMKLGLRARTPALLSEWISRKS